MTGPLLALIPARGGSKGLPGKALAPLGGLPLIAHSIELARRCPEIERVVVSTDSPEIAAAARAAGAEVPFLRPSELAGDETPMWAVVRHALAELEAADAEYDAVLLLQPTSPARLPEDVHAAVALLAGRPDLDGVVGVTEAHPNPIWAAMVEQDGLLRPLLAEATSYVRRQDVPAVVNVNGVLFLWRAEFVRRHEHDPSASARIAGIEIPALRAIDIDSVEDLELAEALLRSGLVRLPWLA